jgi:hypothetical protein
MEKQIHDMQASVEAIQSTLRTPICECAKAYGITHTKRALEWYISIMQKHLQLETEENVTDQANSNMKEW